MASNSSMSIANGAASIRQILEAMYLDHVILVVRDLAADARRLGDALGLVVQPGGEHPGWGTHNAIVRFGQTYLELIAVLDQAQARQRPRGTRLLEMLERGPGWLGFALGVDDLERRTPEIRDRGLQVGTPESGSRRRPDGVELRWRTANLAGPAAWGGALPFLIQHDTPLDVRAGAPAEQQHPLGAIGVSAVGVAVEALAACVPSFVALIGQEPFNDSVGFVQAQRTNFRLDDGSLVRLLRPEHAGSGPVAEHIAERGESVFLIRLAVRDLD